MWQRDLYFWWRRLQFVSDIRFVRGEFYAASVHITATCATDGWIVRWLGVIHYKLESHTAKQFIKAVGRAIFLLPLKK